MTKNTIKIQYSLKTQCFQGFQGLRQYMIRKCLIENRLD